MNEIKHGALLKIEVITILDEALKIGEQIGTPEILWKIYFEYGNFLKTNKDYRGALKYYKKCIKIFKDIGDKLKNKIYR